MGCVKSSEETEVNFESDVEQLHETLTGDQIELVMNTWTLLEDDLEEIGILVFVR